MSHDLIIPIDKNRNAILFKMEESAVSMGIGNNDICRWWSSALNSLVINRARPGSNRLEL